MIPLFSILLPLHDGGRDERSEECGDQLRSPVTKSHGPGVALGYLLKWIFFNLRLTGPLF